MSGEHRIRPILRAIREALRSHYPVPDVHFVIDLDDKTYERKLPIMAFAALHPYATLNSSALLVPDWTSSPPADEAEARADPWSGNLTHLAAIGGTDLATMSSWTRRNSRVVWRGLLPESNAAPRPSDGVLVNLSFAANRWGQRRPYVQLTRDDATHFDVRPSSPSAYLSREGQCGYRHILSLNGDCCHVSHGRLKWALACGAVGIWAQPLWTLHWHHLLEAGTHYLPVPSAEGVRRCAACLRDRPALAHRIALEGHSLVSKYLNSHATSCYWATLLRGYASRMPAGPSAGLRGRSAGVPTIDEYLARSAQRQARWRA